MIHLANKRIVIGEMNQPIKEWSVWFKGPGGLFTNLDEAIKHCLSGDFDPSICIRPVVIAMGDGGLYEQVE